MDQGLSKYFLTVTCLFLFTESCVFGVKLQLINMLYLCNIISHYLGYFNCKSFSSNFLC